MSDALCECGCGQRTRIAKQSDPRHGHVKGQPVRFLKGHSHRGKVVSVETRAKISAAVGRERSGAWRGDRATYRALHSYLGRHFPKASICEECGSSGRTHYALIHGRAYSRSRDDYREMCPRCHMQYDLGGVAKSPAQMERLFAGRDRMHALRRKATEASP